jgi:hypothetical protein
VDKFVEMEKKMGRARTTLNRRLTGDRDMSADHEEEAVKSEEQEKERKARVSALSAPPPPLVLPPGMHAKE